MGHTWQDASSGGVQLFVPSSSDGLDPTQASLSRLNIQEDSPSRMFCISMVLTAMVDETLIA